MLSKAKVAQKKRQQTRAGPHCNHWQPMISWSLVQNRYESQKSARLQMFSNEIILAGLSAMWMLAHEHISQEKFDLWCRLLWQSLYQTLLFISPCYKMCSLTTSDDIMINDIGFLLCNLLFSLLKGHEMYCISTKCQQHCLEHTRLSTLKSTGPHQHTIILPWLSDISISVNTLFKCIKRPLLMKPGWCRPEQHRHMTGQKKTQREAW